MMKCECERPSDLAGTNKIEFTCPLSLLDVVCNEVDLQFLHTNLPNMCRCKGKSFSLDCCD